MRRIALLCVFAVCAVGVSPVSAKSSPASRAAPAKTSTPKPAAPKPKRSVNVTVVIPRQRPALPYYAYPHSSWTDTTSTTLDYVSPDPNDLPPTGPPDVNADVSTLETDLIVFLAFCAVLIVSFGVAYWHTFFRTKP